MVVVCAVVILVTGCILVCLAAFLWLAGYMLCLAVYSAIQASIDTLDFMLRVCCLEFDPDLERIV